MKIKNFLPFLILFYALRVYSSDPFANIQLDRLNYIAHYSKHWQQDSADIQSIREEPMILLIGSEYSKFYSFNSHFVFDSILPRHPLEERLRIVASPTTPRTFNFYKIFKNQRLREMEIFDRVAADLYRYTQPMQIFQWQILPDTMKIFGYAVQKAATSFAGRDWVAWFAPEIPISDGPYKFNGLPGLIVLLHDTRNHYRFALTSFVKNQSDRFIHKSESNQTNAFNTTRERVIAMRWKFVQDASSFMINVTHHGGAAQREEVLQRLRRRNNPLELKY
jgi:GLPGLI family protein